MLVLERFLTLHHHVIMPALCNVDEEGKYPYIPIDRHVQLIQKIRVDEVNSDLSLDPWA